MLRYIARQPILNSAEHTYGYELLYRAGTENVAGIRDLTQASRSVLDDLLTYGIEELTRGRRVFLNCTQDLLERGLVSLLPKENVVLEILENVRADEALVRSCTDLKAAGYTFALDDFVPNQDSLRLMEFADYIKLDFRLSSTDECCALISQFHNRAQFVAEKIETREEYANASAMGCTLFQGYFFAQPSLLKIRDIPPLQLNRIRLLAATCKSDFDFGEVEQIIKSDVALCYKLLRYLNSAAFCLRSNITSLRQALVLLGENAIRRWVCVSAAVEAGSDKSSELVASALLRARFCELLASGAKCNPYRSFVVGLFSLLGTLLGVPIDYILNHVELPPESRAALMGEPSRVRQLFDLACAYIQGDWGYMADRCAALDVPMQQVTSCYVEAVRSVDSLLAIA